MTHARLRRQLSAYLDGELTPADTDDVRAHLAQCATCRRELEHLQSVKALLQRLPERPVPQDLWAAIRGQRDRPARSFAASLGDRLRAAFRRPAVAWAAAGLVVALITGPLVWGRLEQLRAAGVGADLFIREHALASAADPFSDRAYLGLLIGDASLALVGVPREEAREER